MRNDNKNPENAENNDESRRDFIRKMCDSMKPSAVKKVVGIIGGMGPLATADLYEKIIGCTNASCDQEHVHVIIDGNTQIPDRTAAILHGGEDPRPQLIASAKRLQSAGADFLIMPCNTAHYFYDDVCAACDIPVLHMPRETAKMLMCLGIPKVGLLATDGTVSSGVYADAFKMYGVEQLLPDEQGQKEVMKLIYEGVKAGRDDVDITGFVEVCRNLVERGAFSLVLGCTELPVAFARYNIPKDLRLIAKDPTLILAHAAVKFAGGKGKDYR